MDELQNIQSKIYVIRGQRVMLDFDLAKLYEVETKALNQAVKRNPKRFMGEEFMFQLTEEEWRTFKVNFFKSYHTENEDDTDLRSQFVTANYIKKQRFYPYAFSEIGVAMLSSVLKSEVAIQANRTEPSSMQLALLWLRSKPSHLSPSLASLSVSSNQITMKIRNKIGFSYS